METIQRMRHEDPRDEANLDLISEWITTGVTLDFIEEPSPRKYANTPSIGEHAEAVRTRLDEYRQFGAIRFIDRTEPQPEFIQPLHLILREKSKPRIVVDLSRNLNEFIRKVDFHYASIEDAVIQSFDHCWFGKLDLSNCYLSFNMNRSTLKYLCFDFEDQRQQFTRLPFGLCSAPWQCTVLLSVPAFRLKEANLIFTRYLDDFWFVESTPERLTAALDLATNIFQKCGLVVNPKKREGPAQRLVFLGILFDSINQTLSCAPERLEELKSRLQTARISSTMRVREAQSLLGKLSFASQVLPGSRPFMRRLFDTITERQATHRFATLRLGENWQKDCDFWISHMEQWNGTARWRSRADDPLIIATDASTRGFGFHIERIPTQLLQAAEHYWGPAYQIGSGFAGEFHLSHSDLHDSHRQIGWAELFAVLAAIVTYGERIRDQSLLIMIDNQSDSHVINRQRTKSRRIAGILRRIFAELLALNISIRAIHRKGEANGLADFLSRGMAGASGDERVAEWRESNRNSPTDIARLTVCTIVNSQRFRPRSEKPSWISSSPNH